MGDNAGLQGIWNKVTAWFDHNADKYIYACIPREHTDIVDADAPLAPYGGYFRLWLSEMFLKKDVAWGIERLPVVHAEVQLQFGNQQGVTFSRVQQPKLDVGRGVQLNYQLTELMPYNGGVVEIEAALLALQGSDYLNTAVQTLQEFSSLLTTPLEQVLTIASKLVVGTRNLLNAAQGDVHLGMHQAFVSSGSGKPGIVPGYIAVILATPAEIKVNKLSVKSDQLYYTPEGSGGPAPLQDYDYMLFHIEGRTERDDWRLQNIMEPFEKAIEAWIGGDEAKANAYKSMALAAAWKSPDLIPDDRTRVVKALKSEWANMQNEGLGAVGRKLSDLKTIMATRAISMANARVLGELSSEEVFAE